MTSEPDVVASGLGVEEGILRAVPGLGPQLELVAVAYIDTHELRACPYTGCAVHPGRRAFLLADVQ